MNNSPNEVEEFENLFQLGMKGVFPFYWRDWNKDKIKRLKKYITTAHSATTLPKESEEA